MKTIIVAGGTGGHVYPALTLADELSKIGHKITFVGSTTRMEKDLIPQRGYEYIGLDVEIPSGSFFSKGYSLLTITTAYFKCLKLLKGYDLAIGFGNYISIPVMMAAKKLGLKTMIHEQNSFAGKANKFLDKRVDLVVGSYPENKNTFKNKNTLILGNPQSAKALSVIKDKKVIEEFGLDPNKKTVLVFMGSLGSQTVNKIMVEFLKSFSEDYQVIYATGKQNYKIAKSFIDKKNGVVIREAVDGVRVMKNCDLLVCRAGATTIAEITAMGVPSILIPSPYVPNNHQFFNAKTLTDENAAIMLEEKDLSVANLKDTIDSLIYDDEKMSVLAKNAKKLGNPNVLNDIVGAIEKL